MGNTDFEKPSRIFESAETFKMSIVVLFISYIIAKIGMNIIHLPQTHVNVHLQIQTI